MISNPCLHTVDAKCEWILAYLCTPNRLVSCLTWFQHWYLDFKIADTWVPLGPATGSESPLKPSKGNRHLSSWRRLKMSASSLTGMAKTVSWV